ncbi:ejaculatory bulb-specific protein 3-like [Cylas formicarius]|uniref:ejaculatory bulb-specific protein 3-like n=1 Tax=Cylas formicarius TaxID=197179 RepID=UPI0029584662|nr:ejaculatory bulb-specific protein 3-like [Cylas formicarius]
MDVNLMIQFLTSLLVFTSLASSYPAQNEEITTRAPIADETLDSTLNDKRYLLRQLKCAIGEAPCDPVGRRLRSLAPLVLRGSCPQCTPQEQKQIRKVLAYVQVNFPKEWNKVLQQYAG